MAHWLEDEIDKLREKGLNLDQEKVRENYELHARPVDDFFNLLKKSFDDLAKVLGREFKFSYRTLSLQKITEYEFAEFSGINLTQKPAFLRRLQFILSDQPGKIQIILYRGKHDHPDDPWKFHDHQEFAIDVQKMNEELVNELVDWFAWKSYSPRSIR